MKHFAAALALVAALTLSGAWADTVYFETGNVLRNVRIVDAEQDRQGASLLLEPATPAAGVMRGWYPGATRVAFGAEPSRRDATSAAPPRPPIVGALQRAADSATLLLASGQRVRLAGLSGGSPTPSLPRELTSGTKVWIEFDGRSRGEDEPAAWIFTLPSGKLVNETFAAQGFARVDARSASHASRLTLLTTAEQKARKARLGVWRPASRTASASRTDRGAPARYEPVLKLEEMENIIVDLPPASPLPLPGPTPYALIDLPPPPAPTVIYVESGKLADKFDLPPPLPRSRARASAR